jgi:hypothetical protein
MRRLALILTAPVLTIWIGQAAAGDKGTRVELDGLKSTTPASWKKPEKPSSKLRAHEFFIPKADGDKEDAELAIFFFGAGSGGSVEENLKRWKGMMAPPMGKTIDDVSKVDKFKVGKVDITYLDISGTYLFKPFGPNTKVTPKENYRFIGAIFDSENGPYFIRLTGPARTMEQNKKAFDDWLKGFK